MTCALCQFDYTQGSEYESKIEQFWETRGDAGGRGGPARDYGGAGPVDYNVGRAASRGRTVEELLAMIMTPEARDTEYGLGDWARAGARVEEIAAADKYGARLDAARAGSEQIASNEPSTANFTAPCAGQCRAAMRPARTGLIRRTIAVAPSCGFCGVAAIQKSPKRFGP